MISYHTQTIAETTPKLEQHDTALAEAKAQVSRQTTKCAELSQQLKAKDVEFAGRVPESRLGTKRPGAAGTPRNTSMPAEKFQITAEYVISLGRETADLGETGELKVFVGKLSLSVNEDVLRWDFEECGPVSNLKLLKDAKRS